jgi:multisite-specific tRNA:(cytosine-C5)-methyltransferase
LTNDIVKALVLHNDYTRIRLTACGTKIFTKQEGGKGIDAQFRILGEGLPVVLPYTDPNSIINADVAVLKSLLATQYPLCTTFDEPFRSIVEKTGWFTISPSELYLFKFIPVQGSHLVRFMIGDTAVM